VGSPSAPDELTFRELVASDEDALARFLVRNDVPAVTVTFTPFPMTAATAATLLSERREDRYYGAFATVGELVALSMLRGWDEGFVVPSFGIAVDASWHGRGVGTRMTAWTVEQARTLGAPSVRLTVYADNPGARRIYERLGFTERERRAPAGRRESVVMALDLEGAVTPARAGSTPTS
jgi:[ribosomal protein S18]-alanine N-acetyltransferase